MDKLKIGIIGAGYIGSLHAAVLARDERVQIVAIYDAVSEHATALARTAGATVTSSADELIEASDAIYIATPNTQHTDLALASVRAGKHVFCEKPLGLDAQDAERAARACADAGVTLGVGYNWRWQPALREIHRDHMISPRRRVARIRDRLLGDRIGASCDRTGSE